MDNKPMRKICYKTYIRKIVCNSSLLPNKKSNYIYITTFLPSGATKKRTIPLRGCFSAIYVY
jgi:hypothetical protein